MLRIRSLRFTNFRLLRDLEIPLRERTIIVGANNVGKSSVLEGLDAALGSGRRGFGFTEQDVSIGESLEEGLRVTISVACSGPATDDEVGIFGTHLDEVDGEARLFLEAHARNDPEDGVFRTRLRFQKSDGMDDGPVSVVQRHALGVVVLPAMRNARHEFRDRYGLWARFGAQLPVSPEVAAELDDLGRSIGSIVVDKLLGASGQEQLRDRVGGTVGSVLYADRDSAEVAFSLTPQDPAESLRELEVRLATPGQPPWAIERHGTGTQSVALLGLFGAYLRGIPDPPIALGIEEPEAHLHPHAVRGSVRALVGFGSQTILTTHSPAVTDPADPRSLVLLRRRGAETRCSTIPDDYMTPAEMRSVRRYIGEVGSDFLFARAVLFAEGLSERLALPVFAEQLGLDLDSLGVSIVPVGGSSFALFRKLLSPDALNIAHELVCDRDAAKRVVKQVMKSGGMPVTTFTDVSDVRDGAAAFGIHWWSAGTLEDNLLTNGGAPLYVQAFEELVGPAYLKSVAKASRVPVERIAEPGWLAATVRDSKASKPHLAQRVAELFGESGTSTPEEIRTVLERVAKAAVQEARAAGGATSAAVDTNCGCSTFLS